MLQPMPGRDPATGRFLKAGGRTPRRSHSFTREEVETACTILETLRRGGDARLLMRRAEAAEVLRRFVHMRERFRAVRPAVLDQPSPMSRPSGCVTVRRRQQDGPWRGYLATGDG